MTQQNLAQAVGMTQPTIARIERGTVLPRTATLIGLLAATGHRLAVEPIGPAGDHEAIRRRLAMTVPQRTRRAIGRAPKSPETSPIWILRRLRRFGVPFVLIGELAEVAHGSPARVGRVIEVCHASTDVAAERLAMALEDLGRDSGAAHLRRVTRTAAGDDYDVLVRNAVSMHVDSGILVRVAALDDLIRIRRTGCTPQDDEAAVLLRAIQELR
jgi:transcriptional regulator with XRE-family HTH domain